MKLVLSGLILSIPIMLALASSHEDHGSEEKGHHHDDLLTEMYAAKHPIVSHILILLTTMYKGIHSYKMIQGPTGDQQPCFCHKHECPKFTVLCTNAFYEVRKYAPAKFISTSVPCNTIDNPLFTAHKRLHGYLSGENSQGVKMNATRPVAMQSKYPKEGENQTLVVKHKEVYIYIPSEHQKNPPTPTNPDVKIIDVPENVVYVRMFGGLVLKPLWKPKKARFFEVLQAFNQTVNPDYRALALIYDKPSILIHRHNEIFYLAADAKDNEKYCTPN